MSYPSSLPRILLTPHHLPVKESRSVPYVFGGFRLQTEQSGTRRATVPGCRGFDIPASATVYWSHPTAGSIEWAWGVYDYSTSTFSAITSYVAATAGAATFWSAAITAPTVTAGDVYALTLLTRIDGATVFPGIDDSPVGLKGWHSPVYDGTGYGTYPFDVVKHNLANDAQAVWVAHQGWLWPTEPTAPPPSWGAGPSVSYSAGAFAVSGLAAPTWTADTGFAPGINGNPSATGVTGPTIRFQVKDTELTIRSTGYADNLSNAHAVAASMTAAKLASVSGAMDVVVTVFQACGVVSKYGPYSFTKQWDYVVSVP